MSAESTNMIRFRYEIELLEDLHAGSGLGSVWIDRTLARDHSGKPFIPGSHVKGVWRDTMVRLVALGLNGFDENRLSNWFGAAPKKEKDETRPAQSRLHCPRLEPAGVVKSLVWMQTARQPFSRKPAEDTLRTTEYIPAGTTMAGFGFLAGGDDDFKLLKSLIRQVDRYGGNRSRGDGRIRLISIEKVRSENVLRTPKPAESASGLRLLLKAHEPIRVPRTGSPGNIIESDTQIPGRMLTGAIISRLLESGVEPEMLFSQKVAISDALPVNPAHSELGLEELQKVEILPAPLEYRVEKKLPEACQSMQFLPQWAAERNPDTPVTNWRDLLASSGDRADDALGQVKRLPAGTYVQRLGNGPWRAFRQPLELAMRNRRGSDGGYDFGQMDNELFSNEQMPAGTCFVADIVPLVRGEVWSDWLAAFRDYVEKLPFLFVGRGRSPVEIVAATGTGDRAMVDSSGDDRFRLTLIGDAIIRTRWLGFHQRLTLQALRDALGRDWPRDLNDPQAWDVSDSRTDRAFNAATRLPRPSVMVLRAGSSIEVRGKGAKALRDSLEKLFALGERQHEGLGRFNLDLDLISDKDAAAQRPETPIEVEAEELRTETVAAAARQLHAKYKNNLGKPSTSQWGSVRARIDALGRSASAEDLHRIRQRLRTVAANTRGGKVFEALAKDGGFLDKLAGKMNDCWTMEDVRLCLRLVLAQLPRHADPADAGQLGEQTEDLEETEQ